MRVTLYSVTFHFKNSAARKLATSTSFVFHIMRSAMGSEAPIAGDRDVYHDDIISFPWDINP